MFVVLLVSQCASLLGQQRHVVWISGAARGFDVLQTTLTSAPLICSQTQAGWGNSCLHNSDITHHFADGVLGLVQLLPGLVDQALGVSDSVAGTVGLSAGVVHRVSDVLQSVPLGGQSVVDGVQTVQQTSVYICRVKGYVG